MWVVGMADTLMEPGLVQRPLAGHQDIGVAAPALPSCPYFFAQMVETNTCRPPAALHSPEGRKEMQNVQEEKKPL